MTRRRPRTAVQSTALPSLAALLASGVAVGGCDTPAESAGRLQRLTRHGERAERELSGERHAPAATELGVGLGLIPPPPETRIPSPGEAPVVRVEQPIMAAGVQSPTQPTPPVAPPAPVDVDGAMVRVDPNPPPGVRPPTPPQEPPHTAGAPQPVAPHPPQGRPRSQPRGGAPSVSPSHHGEFD